MINLHENGMHAILIDQLEEENPNQDRLDSGIKK